MDYGWHDLAGNLGVAVIILSYLGLQLERIDSRSLLYSALNGIGAVLVILSLLVEFNLSAFVIEIFWVLISIFGIVNRLRAKRVH
jgi:hypothetical protein